MNKWFIIQNEKVQGPYTEDEVRAQVTGGLDPQCLIWGRSQTFWIPVSRWMKTSPHSYHKTASSPNHMNLLQKTDQSVKSEYSAQQDLTSTFNDRQQQMPGPTQSFTEPEETGFQTWRSNGEQSLSSEMGSLHTLEKTDSQQWHYAVEGSSKGPFARSELLKELQQIQTKGEILIWTKGMKAWADLYEFPELLVELGLNRREHARIPVSGFIKLQNGEAIITGQLRSISQGGFSANQLSAKLTEGQTINVELHSPALGLPISAKTIVQYNAESGTYGFKFSAISTEAKSQILEYLRNKEQADQAA